MHPYAWAGALLLAAIHLVGGRLAFLPTVPRSRWLSAASGVSVAYVFVDVLPELAERQEHLAAVGVLGFLDRHVYLASLVGPTLFYGLERRVRRDEGHGRGEGEHDRGVFWLHVGSFALYNVLVGYLLVRGEATSGRGFLFYLVALALHFVVNDYGLYHEHRESYDRRGRWTLAAGVGAGWALGTLAPLHEGVIALLFALLAGGIVLNVLKEELPEERRSRFGAFAAGAAAYAALLLLG